MKTVLVVLLLLNLFWIAYQDFKSREILVVSYLTLFTICIIYLFIYSPSSWMHLIGNGFILSLLGLGITGFYIFRKKRAGSIWSTFGLGDILIILIIALVSHTSVFLFLLITSSIFTIVLSFIMRTKEKDKLPFAGYFSLTSLALISILSFFKDSFFNDPLFYTIFDV